jgi:hypothetical protein
MRRPFLCIQDTVPQHHVLMSQESADCWKVLFVNTKKAPARNKVLFAYPIYSSFA